MAILNCLIKTQQFILHQNSNGCGLFSYRSSSNSFFLLCLTFLTSLCRTCLFIEASNFVCSHFECCLVSIMIHFILCLLYEKIVHFRSYCDRAIFNSCSYTGQIPYAGYGKITGYITTVLNQVKLQALSEFSLRQ